MLAGARKFPTKLSKTASVALWNIVQRGPIESARYLSTNRRRTETGVYAVARYKMASVKATIDYLEDTFLQTLPDEGSEQTKYKASKLWRDSGAVVMVIRRPG